MPVRVAIDVGGTFTDLCALNEATGEYAFVKDSTTPENYAAGVINVVRKSGIPGGEMNRFIGTGSTMVINALTERKGAKTILVTTKGFRDVLEIGRSNRTDIYNFRYEKPKPFVPRRFRYEVDERTSYNGEEMRPLNGDDVLKVVEACNRNKAEAVAIAFYNAYANPKHELECYEILKNKVKTPYITMSHELSREWREYERVNTTALPPSGSSDRRLRLSFFAGILPNPRWGRFSKRVLLVHRKESGGSHTVARLLGRGRGPFANPECCAIRAHPVAYGTAFSSRSDSRNHSQTLVPISQRGGVIYTGPCVL